MEEKGEVSIQEEQEEGLYAFKRSLGEKENN